jgi:hypothetical protein
VIFRFAAVVAVNHRTVTDVRVVVHETIFEVGVGEAAKAGTAADTISASARNVATRRGIFIGPLYRRGSSTQGNTVAQTDRRRANGHVVDLTF